MAVKEELLEFVRKALPFWKDLTPDERREVNNTVSLRMYKKGDFLHKAEEDCAGLLVIRKGQVRAYILSDAGKEITLYRLLEHDICLFSASCIMKNITFDVMIEAEKDSEVLLLPTALYNKLNKHNMAVSDFTNQLLSSRFSDVMWVMEQVMFMSFDKRLAIFLLEQSALDDSDELKMTHEAIAKNLGSAREVVTRMLNYFQNEGYVTLHRGGITIKDYDALNDLSDDE